MKRLHVHVSVKNIEESVKFYSTMFGAQPVKQKSDYAKWLLEGPRVNFAISTLSEKIGLDHFGIQVDDEVELDEVRDRLKNADMKTFGEGETTCCYAQADKIWVTDPAGAGWETYRVMADVEMFGVPRKDEETEKAEAVCCSAKVEKADAKKLSEQEVFHLKM